MIHPTNNDNILYLHDMSVIIYEKEWKNNHSKQEIQKLEFMRLWIILNSKFLADSRIFYDLNHIGNNKSGNIDSNMWEELHLPFFNRPYSENIN